MRKVILITGASSGMGKNGAIRLIKEGHIVYGVGRRMEKMKDLVDLGGHAIQLDMADYKSIKEVVDIVIREQKRIDVLWNNAGYSVMGAVEDVSLEDAKRQFEVNLFGLSEITKAVLPYMRKAKKGTIINTTSVGGKIFSPLSAWYHASKHALEGWSDCLRLEVRPFNVNVVILEPGGVKTEFSDVLMEPLIKRSRGGAYEAFSDSVSKSYRYHNGPKGKLSPPSVISNKLVKIIKSRKPRTRYYAGTGAGIMLWMRKHLSDRMFERIITSSLTIN